MARVRVLVTLDVEDKKEDEDLIMSDVWGLCKDDIYAVTDVKYDYAPRKPQKKMGRSRRRKKG